MASHTLQIPCSTFPPVNSLTRGRLQSPYRKRLSINHPNEQSYNHANRQWHGQNLSSQSPHIQIPRIPKCQFQDGFRCGWAFYTVCVLTYQGIRCFVFALDFSAQSVLSICNMACKSKTFDLTEWWVELFVIFVSFLANNWFLNFHDFSLWKISWLTFLRERCPWLNCAFPTLMDVYN